MMNSTLLQTLGALAARVIPAPTVRPRLLELAFDLPALREEAERAALGRWMTEDGAIHLELQPDGRFAKQRKPRSDAYQGRYEVDGARLYFEADSGTVAVGNLRRGVLSIGEKRFVKQ